MRLLTAGPGRLVCGVRRHVQDDQAGIGDAGRVNWAQVTGDADIRGSEQLREALSARLAGRVQHDALLVAAPHSEAGQPSGGIAGGRLDLDDFRAIVCQQHAGERPRDPGAQFNDADAFQWPH